MDEAVVFFPTWGWPASNDPDEAWTVEIRGKILEPSPTRKQELTLFRQFIGLAEDLRADEALLFEERARPFLVDSERMRRVPIRLNGRIYQIDESKRDGHLRSTLRLSAAEMAAASGGGTEVTFTVVTKDRDPRRFTGVVRLVRNPKCTHVVSDIDDTIKISNVRDKSELLKNTFCRQFRPFEGMAKRYQEWARDGAVFHYVSASPWQLYPPLADFTRRHGFPDGVFYLQRFRLNDHTDHTTLDLVGSQREYKRATIQPVLRRFRQGRFILVGDSGEQDPEVFGQLGRDFPEQIQQIIIRDVTQDPPKRYQRAFENVAREIWGVE